MNEIRKYPVDFTFLFVGLAVLAYFFIRSAHLPALQKKILLAGAVFYFFWGVVHHSWRKEFCAKIVLEYFFISLFAFGAAILVLSWI